MPSGRLRHLRSLAEWAGGRLPSEAECKYAARGGRDGAVFAWGDEERPGGELMANYWQGDFPERSVGAKGWRGTIPVRLFPPNGYGLIPSWPPFRDLPMDETSFSYYNKLVEIHESARKHGVADQDTLHAIDHALALEDGVVVMITAEGT